MKGDCRRENLNICLVSDFFYPNSGGVENHIYQLAVCLIALNHKLVVVTHSYGDRTGIRYMTSGLKVYYLPFRPVYNQCILPTLFATFPLIRQILIREEIDIVHGHSAFSALAHEAMFHAQTMGIRTIFTDHSLFGFADLSSILTNKILRISLSTVNHTICVSHTSKENTVLRAVIKPETVSVIPNAVDSSKFFPDPTQRSPDRITVVVMSRLVYRKGADLLAAIIPAVCQRYPQVHFLIGGDGPKRNFLEETCDRSGVIDRVNFLGSVPHASVHSVLVQGDIFLNTSLTEAFCIAIVEAACSGLSVVSTRVGGVPEVLPTDLIRLAEPNAEDMTAALCDVIDCSISGQLLKPWETHRRVKDLYQWSDIAKRTEKVYYLAMEKTMTPAERISKYSKSGFLFGKFFVFLAILNYIFLWILGRLYPKAEIDAAVTFNSLKCNSGKKV